FGRDMSFVHLGRAPMPTWWVPRPFPPTMLVGWVAGRRAAAFAARFRTADTRLRAALGGLAHALGSNAGAVTAAVEDARVFDWGADPWSRGAYSWIPVGGLDAPAARTAGPGWVAWTPPRRWPRPSPAGCSSPARRPTRWAIPAPCTAR